jgi:thiamine biosynthesis lipoprotein
MTLLSRCILFSTGLLYFSIHRCKRLLILVIFIALYLSCQSQKEYKYNAFIVGGPCEITFYCDRETSAHEIIEQIDDELHRLDSLLNYFSDQSLVSAVNRGQRVYVPEDLMYVFTMSDSIARMTGGLFDISIAPLSEIWGFYRHESNIPDAREIDKAKRLVDYKKIHIENDTLSIPKGMKIDLGGIAQGFAADRVALLLRAHGITAAVINIAGEVVAIGRSPKGRPWHIGIQHPRGEGIIETVELEDAAVSTSGDYEKFFIIGDKRYPHIINPATGYPASDFVSVTIFSKDAAFADALATAVAVMGYEKGFDFLDSLGIRGIIYYEVNNTLKRREAK